MKKKINFDTLIMIYCIVCLVALLTYIIPGGEYQRETKNGRTLVVPNSFNYVSNEPQGLTSILKAPIIGFIQASQIIVFLFVIGGSFSIIQKTGAITASLQSMAIYFAKNPKMNKFFIPVTMTLFSLGGAIFGMCEETMPFILIFIPLAISLGYDSIVGTAIPFLGAAAGFAGALFNPFTIGIAQSIAELPLYSGLGYRIIIWIISTTSMITFVMMYASKIKKNPRLSVMYEIDKNRKIDLNKNLDENVTYSFRHKLILLTFLMALIILIVGIMKFNWYINEIAALFLLLGILSGLIGKVNLNEISDAFKNGAKDMIGVALIIGCARGILVIATDGKILDTILFGLSNIILKLHPILAAQAMFVTQGIINFFVHSGSGQAALTIPIMAPLSDLIGITRQTAILAFQFGEGWINPILPTSGVTMGVLGLAGISWEKWFKWMLPLQIYFFILALLLLIPPVLFHYGPY